MAAENQIIILDNGYSFGMGIFETIAVENGQALFLPWHLERMEHGLDTLGISKKRFLENASFEQLNQYLKSYPMAHGVLKIMVSENNCILTTRENPYTDADYQKGFYLDISCVIRNETSPFTYIKSFHYGNNLLEKARAKKNGFDETLFLNSKGEITETSASNIFFVKGENMYTPPVKCGLLDGIIRRYVKENYAVEERIITPEEIKEFDEAFLTNSLMGIMPVTAISDYTFPKRSYTSHLLAEYLHTVPSKN